MAGGFVEQATLILNDKSSTKIKKINAELKKLDATAKSVKKSLAGIKLNVPGATKATRDLNTFITTARKINSLKMTPKVNMGNISNATRAIARLHAQANRPLRQQTLRIRRLYSNAGPGMLRGGTQRVRFDTDSLGGVLNRFVDDLGARLSRAIAEGIKIGYTNRDIADTRKTQLSLTDAQRSVLERHVADNARSYPGVPQAQGANLFTEILPTVNQNMDAAKDLLGLTSAIVQFRTAIGDTTQTAVDSALNIIKAGEQSGAFSDSAGNYDPQGARAFFKLAQQASAIIGKEFDSKFVRDFITNLGATKQTLNDRGLASGYLLAEEMKSPKAGVSINQLIKQLGGRGVTKGVLSNLEDWGLISTREVKEGTSNGKTKTTTVVGGQKDAALLANDPVAFVGKYIIPEMRKRGLDPNNPVDSQKVAYDLTGNKTAVAGLQTIINRYAELERQATQMLAVNASPEKQQEIFTQSGLAQLQATQAQIASLLGEISNSFESYLIPVLTRVQGAARSLSEWVTPPGEEPSKLKAGLLGGGALAGGFAAFFGAKKAIDWMTGLPGNTAATAANTAALAANTAALAAATGGNAAGTLAGGKGKGKGLLARGVGLLTALGGAYVVGETIANGAEHDKKTGNKDGIKHAILDTIADLVVAGRDNKAWAEHDAVKAINSTPFIELPPMNRAEERASGLFDLKVKAPIEEAFTTGSATFGETVTNSVTQISAATQGVGATITDAFVSGASSIAAAITNALAAGVKVNMNNLPGAKPLDTGDASLTKKG
jgi:hypothetical protein